MHFHAEVPLIALLGLMHLRVAHLALVLGRWRGMDDCGIHHRAALEQQAYSFQHVVNRIHELRRPFVAFQQTPEIQNGGFIRQRIVRQLQLSDAAHRFDFIQGVFQAGSDHCCRKHSRSMVSRG
jgi:hypothetical protein